MQERHNSIANAMQWSYVFLPLTHGSKPMLINCQLDHWEQISGKFESKYNNFHTRKWFWKCWLQNGWYECYGISNHRQNNCQFKNLLRLTTKKHQSGTLQALCAWNPVVTSEYPTRLKGKVMRKVFQWQDLIITLHEFFIANFSLL